MVQVGSMRHSGHRYHLRCHHQNNPEFGHPEWRQIITQPARRSHFIAQSLVVNRTFLL